MSVFTVTTLTDENDGIDVGGVSLRDAIEAANATPGRDIIRFNARLSGIISLTQGELAISDSVVIRGLGADTLTIDAGGNSRVFNIDDDSDENYSAVTIQGLTITGGHTEYTGGGIYSTETLKVLDSVITNNTSSYEDYDYFYYTDGGGIYQSAGSLLVKNSDISINSGYYGGGIFASSGDVRVINSNISSNSSFYGGGIYSSYGDLRVINSNISNNSSEEGGGIHTYSDLRVIDSNIVDNGSSDAGGGIYTGGDLRVINSDISSNNTGNYGGGIYSSYGDLRVINSNISSNNTGYDGGGIYTGGDVRVINSDIADNSADSEGGGIYSFSGNVGVVRSFVTRNSATLGAGLYNRSAELKIVQSTIDDNTAGVSGGGISNSGTTIVNSSSITGNSATDEGGGVFNSGTFRAFNSTIAGNTLGEGESDFRNEFYGPAGVIVVATKGDDEIFGGNSDDILKGRHGDDRLVGGAGDDRLFGHDGDDILIGVNPRLSAGDNPGENDIDVLTGGGGNDLFVLGDTTQFGEFYTASGDNDYALIKDFTTSDTIRLVGTAADYLLSASPAGLPSGVRITTDDNELIAIVQGNASSSLDLASGTGFEFVN